MRVVAPFRPFPLESPIHRELASFDWIQAVRMMMHTAGLACHCPVHVITDVDTELPVSCLKYQTHHRRLMLWSLEVALKFLESDDFDRDTVMLDSDQLIYRDLSAWFRPDVDLTVCIRTGSKHQESGRVLLNGVQHFAHHAKPQLIAFYRQALAIAEQYPEGLILWGADTEAVQALLSPFALGVHERAGVRVWMVESTAVIESLSSGHVDALERGTLGWPRGAVIDCRARRKLWMREFYEATIGAQS